MLRVMASTFAILLLAAAGGRAEPFEPKLLSKLGSDRFRYPGAITHITVSANGKYVAVAGSAPTRVYDFATGRLAWMMPGDQEGNFSLTYAEGFRGDHFVAFRIDSLRGLVVQHFDFRSPHPVHTALLKLDVGEAAAISPDGTLLAIPIGRRVRLFDTQTGRDVNRVLLPRGSGNAEEVVFSANGRRLAVKVNKGTVHTFDCLTGRELARFKPRPATREFTLSPDGNRLSAILEDNSLESLNLLTGERKKWRVGDQTFDHVVGLNDDQLLTMELTRGTWQVFDAATGRLVRKMPAMTNSAESFVEALALTPDGRTLLCGSNGGSVCDGVVTAWDIATGQKRPQSADEQANCTRFLFHGTDRLSGLQSTFSIVDGGPVSTWRRWQMATGRGGPLPTQRGLSERNLSPDGLWLISVRDNRVTMVNTVTGKPARTLTLPPETDVSAVWFYQDARRVGVNVGNAVLIWDLATNRTRRIDTNQNGANAVISSGRWFAWWVEFGESDKPSRNVLRTLDLETGRVGCDLTFPTRDDDWRFTPDGRLVRSAIAQAITPDATAAASQDLSVLDPATGRVIRRFTVAAGERLLDISADGRTVLTAANNEFEDTTEGSVGVTEAATGKVRWQLPALPDWAVTGGSFAPDGRRLAVGTTDGFVRVWDIGGTRTSPDALTAARLWDELAGPDAEKAFAAIVALGHVPEVAVPLLQAKVGPAVPVAEANIERWLRDLDSPVFANRRDATRNLRPLATRVRPAMESLLKTTPSPEARERLTDLLESATRPMPAEVKVIRAVEVLERIATDRELSADGRASAIELLRSWAAGADGATMTTEAKETLNRLRLSVQSPPPVLPASAPGTLGSPAPAALPR
ncbi:WD40 repeat domain-containing protein [Limnoglobus roseus]|uniref:WD40 repeat domain-containing protein n=1 Tax=Limnoglobus roseus TaxID=2598579 RepID=A0A5C1A9P6_9BACT|nr:WD40 repeat domain-containing protein [Limnoglobus roseus]QEL14913.1 WD40 repeat domain-containing protein [Limnoglobus roseus]